MRRSHRVAWRSLGLGLMLCTGLMGCRKEGPAGEANARGRSGEARADVATSSADAATTSIDAPAASADAPAAGSDAKATGSDAPAAGTEARAAASADAAQPEAAAASAVALPDAGAVAATPDEREPSVMTPLPELCRQACANTLRLVLAELPEDTARAMRDEVKVTLERDCPGRCLQRASVESARCIANAKGALELAACP